MKFTEGRLRRALRGWCMGLLAILSFLPGAQAGDANSARPIRLVAYGDSLTAGFGLAASAAFPAQLQVALQAKGYKVDVVNAGVSGDTSAGGLQRLDWTMQPDVDGVILELGANDALRGIDPKLARDNLDKIINVVRGRDADILLAGMRAPANWGSQYQTDFDAIFPELAKKYNIALYPFFLDGVLGVKGMVLDDGLHPTPQGVAEIVKRILPDVEALLQKITARLVANATK